MGKLDKAIERLSTLQQEYPKNRDILEHYLRLSNEAGNWGESVRITRLFFKSFKDYGFYDLQQSGFALMMDKDIASARRFVKKNGKKINLGKWEGLLYKHFIGAISDELLLKKATNPCQRTEALYSVGMFNMKREHFDKAAEAFRQVLEEKVFSFVEYMAARYHLKRLESGASLLTDG